MKNLFEEAKGFKPELVEWRRYIHKNAETHTNLETTTAYVSSCLKAMGYEPIEICKSGILAVAGGKKPGKTFLIRGDMDALPVEEQTGLDFSSGTGNMHACGHDLHTAMMLGAARLLKTHEDEIEGTVKLMFQPAEETLAGAKMMIEAGILEKPTVDAAMMIHVFSGLPIASGTVVFYGAGAVSAASDWFLINIKGKGGHGAMPNTTIDPVNTAAHIHIALGEINSREIDPAATAVVTVGEIHGGTTGNIIPDTAFLRGTIRTFDNDIREFIKKRVVEISKGIGTTFRCEVEVELSNACPSVVNDRELTESVYKYTAEMLGPQAVLDMAAATGKTQVMSGSEDFAFLSERVPSLMIIMAASVEKNGEVFPQHHPRVLFDENTLPAGAAVYANSALEWLKMHK
ncbi:MAG: amidohydrolase [Clostridia bacterium]|nr:amidohydrolase [Clostridia bacterium]